MVFLIDCYSSSPPCIWHHSNYADRNLRESMFSSRREWRHLASFVPRMPRFNYGWAWSTFPATHCPIRVCVCVCVSVFVTLSTFTLFIFRCALLWAFGKHYVNLFVKWRDSETDNIGACSLSDRPGGRYVKAAFSASGNIFEYH